MAGHYPTLPTEIWIEIFKWATYSPRQSRWWSSDIEHDNVYVPFERAPGQTIESETLNARRNLGLVCKQWKVLTEGFLYQDVNIRRGAHALRELFDRKEQHGSHHGLARLFSRIQTVTGPHVDSVTPIEILKCCTEIKTLVRPQYLQSEILSFEFDIDCPRLPLLRRLEWWHNREAARSGGINSLQVVLQNAPNLRYLFLGGVPSINCIGLAYISLPELQTLRFHLQNSGILRMLVTRWSLPSLKCVITDTPMTGLAMLAIWETYGSQLLAVEFGKHLRFLMFDYLTQCMKLCPNLESISYSLFFAVAPNLAKAHRSIKYVNIDASVNDFLVDGESIWAIINQHFSALLGGMFPALERIVFYGDWRGIISHQRFNSIRQQLHSQACVMELADGTPVTA
ncbi:hypothetical protein BD779DRAFT_1666862 [Infundibulicybe gibba]|nr:hypothetical protein BD779DRAFT_1666862 [Infundibulicybe gibba]